MKNKPNKYYPVFLDIRDKKIIVVGGGEVALRKTEAILECGGKVTLISPVLNDNLTDLNRRRKIRVTKREYRKGDIDKSYLVIAATDNNELNVEISKEAKKKNIPVNVVDLPQNCDFIIPSTIRRGNLVIAISTEGTSPALARKIRQELEETFGDHYAEFLKEMKKIRGQIINKISDIKKRKEIFEKLVNSDIIDLLKRGEKEVVMKRIKEIAGI